jgi:hypothetical protein
VFDSFLLATLNTLITAIRAARDDPNDYKNPAQRLKLPFPYTGEPHDRFTMTLEGGVSYFEFVGREKFEELHQAVLGLGQKKNLQLYGTIGFGKSHLLAALAVLLMLKGRRVVYLPDCKKMLLDPAGYMKKALLLTLQLAPLDDDEGRASRKLLECASVGELEIWRKSFIGIKDDVLTFFVGQASALDPKGSSADHDPVGVDSCRSFLKTMCGGQLRVDESSANNAQAAEDSSSQSKTLRVTCLGGLTMAEYNASEFKQVLGKLEPVLSEEVVDATGNIPLLLHSFVGCLLEEPGVMESEDGKLDEVVFVKVWEKFVLLKEVREIRKELEQFSAQQRIEEHFTVLLRMVCEARMLDPPSCLYDARFSYWKDGQGACVCGLARKVMGELVFKHSQQIWRDQVSKISVSKVPSVLGFAAEEASLASIACDGVCIGPLKQRFVPGFDDHKHSLVRHFETGHVFCVCCVIVYLLCTGTERSVASEARCGVVLLGLPGAWNYTAVDGVMILLAPAKGSKNQLQVPYMKEKTIAWATCNVAKIDGLIGGIQVTAYADITAHFTSTYKFFASCDDAWKGSMKAPGYFLLWVVKASSKAAAKLPAQRVNTIHGKTVFEFFVTFSELGCHQFDL